MAPRVGVVQFPGSNCELDALEAIGSLGGDAEILWHGDATVNGVDAVIVPGGFAHGDYLRPGAIARFSPVMSAVVEFAKSGGPVVGICNGFQVLTEAGLLPGALQKNRGLKFLCTTVELRVDSTDSVLTSEAELGAVLRVPINHFEGNYTCSPETLAELQANEQVVLRYVDEPERFGRRHRRDLQRGPQRGGPHAAPRARDERPAGLGRRCAAAAVAAAARGRRAWPERSGRPGDAGGAQHGGR